jgi:hypothetical protein
MPTGSALLKSSVRTSTYSTPDSRSATSGRCLLALLGFGRIVL